MIWRCSPSLQNVVNLRFHHPKFASQRPTTYAFPSTLRISSVAKLPCHGLRYACSCFEFYAIFSSSPLSNKVSQTVPLGNFSFQLTSFFLCCCTQELEMLLHKLETSCSRISISYRWHTKYWMNCWMDGCVAYVGRVHIPYVRPLMIAYGRDLWYALKHLKAFCELLHTNCDGRECEGPEVGDFN